MSVHQRTTGPVRRGAVAAVCVAVTLSGLPLISANARVDASGRPAAARSSSGPAKPFLGKPVPGAHAHQPAVSAPAASAGSVRPPAPVPVAPGVFRLALPRAVVPHPLRTRSVAGITGTTPAATAGAWQPIGASGIAIAAANPTSAPVTPRSTSPSGPAAAPGAPAAVTATILTASQAAQVGVTGLAIKLTGSTASGGTASGPVAVRIPDALLAGRFGADYAARVRWLQLPTTSTGHASVPVAHTRDAAATATVLSPQLSARPTVLAAAAAPVSATGTGSFAATSLKPSAAWQVSTQSGDFSWSYPVPAPPAAAGPAPGLALSYDSQSIDGETGSSNNQPDQVGDGWTLAGGGFIERSYVPCSQDDGVTGPVASSGDLCWRSDNATVSLGGHSGELVKDSSGTWKLRGDDGSRVEHLTGAANGCVNSTRDDDCWRLTTSEGIQYYFGRNQLPGWASGNPSTNSVWTVPVFGNDPGEPGYNGDGTHAGSFASEATTQAWRWNLDYVLDPNANSEAFYYDTETNHYQQNGATFASYVRGGVLDHIDYGMRAGSEYATNAASDRVLFGQDSYGRCSDFSSTRATNCTPVGASIAQIANPAKAAHPTYYPDTPWDQYCTAAPCTGQLSPTFFTTQMLSTITAQARVGTSLSTVNVWSLTHSFPDPGDGTSAALWLTKIGHTGYHAGSSLSDPVVTLYGTTMQNRVWVIDGLAPLDRYRISSIRTQTGAVLSVNYSAQQCTPGGAAAIEASPQTNTQRCYPQWWTPQVTPAQAPQQDLFHKYVVTSVTDNPTTGGAQDAAQVTQYVYTGTPAWRFDTSPATPDEKRSWSDYAGYSSVEVRVGDPNTPAAEQTTDYTFFQGLDGDPSGTDQTHPSTSVRSVNVAASDHSQLSDARWWAGQVRETIVRTGANGGTGPSSTPILTDTITTPWASPATATSHYTYAATDPTNHKAYAGAFTTAAYLTGTASAHHASPLSTGGYRTVDDSTVYDPTSGLPTQVQSATSDAGTTCTSTSYASNTAAWLIAYPARVTQTDTACDANLSYPDDIVADTATYYDGSNTLGAAATRGNPTATQRAQGYSGSSPNWLSTARASYDPLGRPISVTDALGRTSTTSYSPAGSGPLVQSIATSPAPFDSWATTTTYDPAWGAPSSVTDPNNHATTAAYDPLGRLVSIWLPDRPQASNPTSPSTSYAYTQTGTGPLSVATTAFTASGSRATSYALADGLGRPVQTQSSAEGGGTVLTDTGYDPAGRATLTNNPYWTTSVNPSATLFVPASQQQVPSQLQTGYDGAGRVTSTTLQSLGTARFHTSYSYPGTERVDMTPPAGGTPTSTYNDARGRTRQLVQYLAATISGTATTEATSYTYNARGQMSAMTDPAGHQWSWAYNVLGQQTSATDPDTGTTSHTYDAEGQASTSTDATGTTLSYSYDQLGRKTGEYTGADPASGVQLADWRYDPTFNNTQVKGQLAGTDRYLGGTAAQPGTGTAYTTTITGYTVTGKPTGTTVTLPLGALGANSAPLNFTTSDYYGYDGSLTAQVDPAEGNLAAETIRYGYDSLGNLSTLDGTKSYLAGTSRTGIGQVAQYMQPGPVSGYQTYGYDQGTGTVTEIKDQNASNGAYTTVADTTYSHDDAGNTTSAATTAAGQPTDTQCYSYDHQANLTQAWTPATSNCTTPPTSSSLGGPAPYWTNYTLDPTTGNRTSQTTHATTPTGTDSQGTYNYPSTPPGGGHGGPNAVQSITHATAPAGTTTWTPTSTDTYTYDPAGHTTTRPGQTLTYDPEGHLSATTLTDTTSQANVYTADGALLLQTDPTTGATAYLGDTELHTNPGDTTITATRTYTANGTPIAERTSPTSLYWLYTNTQNTAALETDTTTATVTRRYTDPYGNPRGTTPTWTSTHTYLNAPHNTFSNLIHLGARQYDPSVGRFLTVDPILDPADPQSVNGYAYADNNPVANSDPTGNLCTNGPDGMCHTGPHYSDPSTDRHGSVNVPTYGYSDNQAGEGNSYYSTTPSINPSGNPTFQSWTTQAGNAEITRKAHPGTGFLANGLLGLIQFIKHPISSTEQIVADTGKSFLNCISHGDISDCVNTAATALYGLGVAAKLAELSKLRTLAKLDAADTEGTTAGDLAKSCGNSFTSDTPVTMADGSTKLIKDVKVGDKVLATDPQTGQTKAEPVVALIRHSGVHAMVLVTLANGSVLDATGGHKIWDATQATFVDADQLRAGDKIETENGALITIADLTSYSADLTAYNLQISTIHTYYAGTTPVLVHNSCDNIADLPARAARNITEDPGYAYQRLNLNHGVTREEFGNQIHAIKRANGLPGDFNLGFGPTGDVWNPQSGELIGRIAHG